MKHHTKHYIAHYPFFEFWHWSIEARIAAIPVVTGVLLWLARNARERYLSSRQGQQTEWD